MMLQNLYWKSVENLLIKNFRRSIVEVCLLLYILRKINWRGGRLLGTWEYEMTHSFFTAANNFWLKLKTSHRTILQTCHLSPSDGEISPFWFNSPRLPLSANNLLVSGKNSDAPRKNSSSQIIHNTPFALCFVSVL